MNALKMYRRVLTKMGVKVKKAHDLAHRKTALEEAVDAGKLPEELDGDEVQFLKGLGYEVEAPEGEAEDKPTKKSKKDKSKGKTAKADKAPKLTKAERKAARIAAAKALKGAKTIAIWGNHKGKTYKATLVNRETVVDSKGRELGTPSKAAKSHTEWAVNGWLWWKFKGKDGTEAYIDTLRDPSEVQSKPRKIKVTKKAPDKAKPTKVKSGKKDKAKTAKVKTKGKKVKAKAGK